MDATVYKELLVYGALSRRRALFFAVPKKLCNSEAEENRSLSVPIKISNLPARIVSTKGKLRNLSESEKFKRRVEIWSLYSFKLATTNLSCPTIVVTNSDLAKTTAASTFCGFNLIASRKRFKLWEGESGCGKTKSSVVFCRIRGFPNSRRVRLPQNASQNEPNIDLTFHASRFIYLTVIRYAVLSCCISSLLPPLSG